MTIGLDGVSDLDESDSSSSTSSSSSTDDSSESEYPRYFEETPYIAVAIEGDSLATYNRAEHIEIVYRQYSKESDMKLHEVPEYVEEYWMSDWSFRAASYRYEKETGRSLIDDLREKPEETLSMLRGTSSGSGVSRQVKRCAVCSEELDREDDYVVIQSKRVHADHTTSELVDAGVMNIHTRKEVTDGQGDSVRQVQDTSNRRWE